MPQSIINKETGELCIADNFNVNAKTTLPQLQKYFGKRLKVKLAYKTFENGIVHDLKIHDWYFIMTFYYNADRLTHISFYPRDEEVNTASWDNFDPEADRDYYTNWMAAQLGDTKKFKWDLNQAGRHYSFSFAWGDVGVYYDFKGGTYSCIIGFNA